LCPFDHPTFESHQKNVGEGFMRENLGVDKKKCNIKHKILSSNCDVFTLGKLLFVYCKEHVRQRGIFLVCYEKIKELKEYCVKLKII
jgi:hypothetical protein